MALTIEKRLLRALCSRSRRFNMLVGALEMRLGSVELASLPQFIAVCVSGRCNALCPFCTVSFRRGGIVKEDLEFEDFQRIVDPMLEVLQVVGFEGNGEPTLNPEFMKMFDYVARRPLHTYLITNGQKLDKEMADRLITGKLGQVNISMNAASEATRRISMGVSDHHEQVVENVRYLVQERNRRGQRTWWTPKAPRITISFVVIEQNLHEVVPFLKLADELGVDEVYVRPLAKVRGIDTRDIVPNPRRLSSLLGEIDEVLPHIRPIVHFDRSQFAERAQDDYNKKPLELSALAVQRLKPSFRVRCQKPWTDYNNFSVSGEMDFCCMATGQEFSLGKVSEHPFEEIWNGPMARRFRRTINSAEPLLACKVCPQWQQPQGHLFDPELSLQWVDEFLAATNAPLHRLLGKTVDRFLRAFAFRHVLPPRRQRKAAALPGSPPAATPAQPAHTPAQALEAVS